MPISGLCRPGLCFFSFCWAIWRILAEVDRHSFLGCRWSPRGGKGLITTCSRSEPTTQKTASNKGQTEKLGFGQSNRPVFAAHGSLRPQPEKLCRVGGE